MAVILVSRRPWLVGFAATSLAGCARMGSMRGTPEPEFAAIERNSGGRIGIAALDVTAGAWLKHRADERFAMCSTFKWLLGALVLQRAEAGEESLERVVPIARADLVVYSPVTEPAAGTGLTVRALCSAAIRTSDNTAANLLLATLGGPAGFTARLRDLGDPLTRLDRLEPLLNENAPGDPRDTSTPAAMVETMRKVLFGTVLGDASRALLRTWLIDANTGLDRLRAGVPVGWTAGDKTGTSERDQTNDLAFALPPAGAAAGPILIVSNLNIPDPASAHANATHADIARRVFAGFARG